MKKANRKLIPAVAMLLVSAIMMSTASFAWFTMNGTVEATGMKVKAEVSESLLISTKPGEGFAPTVAITDTGHDSMVPVTSSDGYKFAKLKTGTAIAAEATSQTKVALQASDLEDAMVEGTNYAEYTYYLKGIFEGSNKGVAVEEIKINNHLTTDIHNAGLDGAIKVAFALCGDTDTESSAIPANNWKIFNPTGLAANKSLNATDEYKAGHWNADGSKWELALPTYLAPSAGRASTAQIGQLAKSDTAQKLVVRVWFEGQDDNCTTVNGVAAKELAEAFSFKIGYTAA